MKKNILSNSRLRFIQLVMIVSLVSCESFVEVGAPKTESVSSTVYADDVTALAALRGIYHEMVRSGFSSGLGISTTFECGVASDEMKSFNTTLDEFYNNDVTEGSSTNSSLWNSHYKIIYYCNSLLDGIRGNSALSASARNQLEGEGKFLRAFTYFYLYNTYGDVPLILSTDYKSNATSKRNGREEIYSQIIQDLTEAQALLSNDFQFTSGERVRATSWAAAFMLARVYLYSNDAVNAEKYATIVINNASLFKLVTDPNAVFLKNSTESILQLMPVVSGQNTNEALAFVPVSNSSLPSFASLTDNLYSSFEAGDKRKTNWIGVQTVSGTPIYYPLKYKVSKTGLAVTEYSIALRLSELFLIRAEAKSIQGKLLEAMTDLDVVRSRAGLPSIQTKIAVPTSDNVLNAIVQERKVELFSEWGHRWFDLKRLNRATTVLQPLKIGWQNTDVLYPIPQLELSNNPNLNPQNPGY